MSRSDKSLPAPVSGTFYDGQGSGRHSGVLHVTESGRVVIDGAPWAGCDVADLNIPSRVGNSARLIQLPGGVQFETTDNAGIDRLQACFRPRPWYDPHHFESRLRYVLASVAAIALAVWLAVVWLVPTLSNVVARQLPSEFAIGLGADVLTQLDEYYFERTTLPRERRMALDALFQQAVPAQTPFPYQLHFRDGGLIGANALALPDGSIVITDQMVRMADSDEELLSIFLHEVGHVEHRHGLRRVLESTGVALLAIWLTGDLEGAADWVAVLPTLLVQSSYSRSHEWEADGYALDGMRASGVDPRYFADFMQKVACLEYRAGYYADDPEAPAAEQLCPGDLNERLDALEEDLAHADSDAPANAEPMPNDKTADKPVDEPAADVSVSDDTGTGTNNNIDGAETDTAEDEPGGWGPVLRNVFATHPATLDRIERFRAASAAP